MKSKTLLSREKFRELVFHRDNGLCVICKSPAQDAHHILERRLWSDGGYYLDNGASVCGKCHLKCESTDYSVEFVRECCGITNPILPEHLYSDNIYDKWGNIILPNGTRLKGELFFDESVQKIINSYLYLFVDTVKYPRTYHLPWSKNITDDDRVLPSLDIFEGKEVIVTEKVDGENTSLYRNDIHARSLDSQNHPSRNWIKNFWGTFRGDIPEGWRICGENMFAKHSIGYDSLESFFYGFSVWNDKNICLSWDETLEWFDLLNITPVPILYTGIFDINEIKGLHSQLDWGRTEGYVVRLADSFSYGNFRNSVAKYVRQNHLQTVKHWMHGQPIEKNKLK